MSEIDLTLALQLQAQFEEELRVSLLKQEEQHLKSQAPIPSQGHAVNTKWKSKGPSDEPPQEKLTVSLIDPSWELVDPNPDIHTLFLIFNDQFFWGRLSSVEVKWSPRMTLCAGLCRYEGRGGLCSVHLSMPLLKLRPRKDLIETLLHEMIHAYLFVTANNRDRDGHGPEFHKHMYRINGAAGTRITVFHSFHDEVDVYRQHIWQCDGPCRTRRPYFGLLKRAMNRAPSPRDPWWASHQQSCGGTYTKIQEPQGYVDKKKKNSTSSGAKKNNNCGDIRDFITYKGKGNSLGASDSGSSKISKPVPSSSQISKPVPSSSQISKPVPSSSQISKPIPSSKQETEMKTWNLDDTNRSVSTGSVTKKINGLASSSTGTVRKVHVDNASRSNVNVLSGGSPSKKKPRYGEDKASAAKPNEKPAQKSNGGFGTGLASRGAGSRTVTVKGKNADKTDHQVDNEPKTSTLKPTVFQGQGNRLGGLNNGVSRLLSISSLPMPSGPPTTSSSRETENLNVVDMMNSGGKEKQDKDSWISRSPKKGQKSQSIQKSLDDYIASPSSEQSSHDINDSVKCPVCNEAVSQRVVNEHLDECLG